MGRPRKPLWHSCHHGFESHTFRHDSRVRRAAPGLLCFSVKMLPPARIVVVEYRGDLRARVPVIQTDNSGNVTAIRLNSRSIAAIDLDAATTERFYAALRTFIEIVSGEESVIEIMLDAGNLVAFDNRRVLHGRSEFDVTDRRHLQGRYIDIDAVRSDVLVAAR